MSDNTEGVRVLLGDQRKGVLALSVPIAIALLVQNLNNIVDSFWVADLGEGPMAAIGVVYPLYTILIGVGNGLGIGVAAAIARNIGLKNHEDANGVAAQGLVITLIVSVVMTVVLIATAEPVIELMGGGSISDSCLEYGFPIYLGSFFIVLSGVMSGMLRGEGAARRSMAIQVVGAAVNIILDPVLIFTFGMGVAGAAWATVIAFVVSSLMAFYWYFRSSEMYIRFERKNFGFNRKLQKEILGVGLPETFELTIMNFFNIFLNLCVIMCAGNAGLAVYTMVWRIGMIAVIPAQAMGGAMVAVCSAEYGMKEYDMIRDAYAFTIRRSMVWLIAVSAVFALFAGPIADVFLRTDDMLFMHQDMVLFSYALAVMIPPFSLVYIGSSLLQSIDKAGHAMVNSLVRNIVVTLGYWLMAVTFGTLMSIGWCLIVVETLGGIAMVIHGKIILEKVAKADVST